MTRARSAEDHGGGTVSTRPLADLAIVSDANAVLDHLVARLGASDHG